jgi:protection-of-telomeres protein 1
MELNLPPSFVDVFTAESSPRGTMVNVIGIIVDYQPPVRTKGPGKKKRSTSKHESSLTLSLDYVMTLRLTDHCCYKEGGRGEGMGVRIFEKKINLPLIECVGDVVLLRQFKRMDVNGVPYLTSSWSSHIICFPAATIPDPAFKHAFGDQDSPPHTKHPVGARSSGTENYYIIALRDWASGIKDLPRKSFQLPEETSLLPPKGPSKLLSLPKKPPPPATAHNDRSVAALSAPEGLPSMAGLPPQRAQPSTNNVISKYQDKKFSFLKDIKDGTYVTLVGEVRKLWGNLHGTQMYLTDYTSNSLLFDYKSNDGQAEGQDGDTHGYLANTQRRGWGGPFGRMTIQITLWPPHDSFVNIEVVEGEIVLVRNVHITFRNKYLEGKLHTDRRFPQKVDVRKIPQADPLVLALEARKADYEDHKLAAENKRPSHKAEKKKRRKQERERLARQQGSGGNETPDSTVETRQEKHVLAEGELDGNGKAMILLQYGKLLTKVL